MIFSLRFPADIQFHVEHRSVQRTRDRFRQEAKRRRVAQSLDRLQQVPREVHDKRGLTNGQFETRRGIRTV